jgi:hypothetical protein
VFEYIDNQDLTLQVESNKVDIAVPDGKAFLKRSYSTAGINLSNDKGFSFREESELSENSGTFTLNPRKFLAFLFGTNTTTSTSITTERITTGDGAYDYEDVVVDTDTTATTENDTGVSIGPILVHSRAPIAVSKGMRLNMSGSVTVRRTGTLEKDDDDNSTPIYAHFSMWGIGTKTDEYGVESDNIIELMWWKSLLQNSASTGEVNFTIPAMADAEVPEDINQVYFSVALKNGKNEWHTGAFKTASYSSGKDIKYLRFFTSNPVKIFLKDSPGENSIQPSSISIFGGAYQNRKYFSNLYPLYGDNLVTNSSFSNDLAGWSGASANTVISSEESHIATKSLRITNSGDINNAASETATSPGKSFYMSIWMKNISFSGSGGIRLQRQIASTGAWTDWLSTAYPAIGSWTKSEISGVVPADTNAVRARVAFAGTGIIFVDDVELREGIDDNEITLIGNSTAAIPNLQIFATNGVTRGNLIKSLALPANGRVTLDISSATGAIELVNSDYSATSPSGINKTGTQDPGSSSWTKLTNFTTRTGYTGTVINNSSIQITVAGNIEVIGYIKFEAASIVETGWFGYKKNPGPRAFRVLKNGVVMSTYSRSGSGLQEIGGQTGSISVAVDDLITFEVYVENETNTSRRTVTADSYFVMNYIQNTFTSFYVEKVVPKKYETLNYYQNHLNAIDFMDVIDEVSSIKIERAEADAGLVSISFASNLLDPALSSVLKQGKVIRVLGRHYGSGVTSKPSNWTGEAEHSKIVTAVIKRVETVYDYLNEPQIKVTAFDIYSRIDQITPGVAYDKVEEYGALLNTTGVEVELNGMDVSGKSRDFPDGFEYFPSAYGNFTMMDALIMTRNSQKTYLYIDRDNRLVMKPTLDSAVKLTITDGLMPGDISMSSVKQGSDTETVINKIEVEENLLDRKDFFEERDVNSEEPPINFGFIKNLQRVISYKDQASIDEYGEYSKKFQVVRGTGAWDDIVLDNYGPAFKDWSQAIFNEYSDANIRISEISIPIKNSAEIKMISDLEILDKVAVRYKDQEVILRIRQIKHDIVPGRWRVTLSFAPSADQTYWND